MDRWDMLLMGGSVYVAVISLVRLMARRRNQLIQQVHREIEEQRSAPPPATAESTAGKPAVGDAAAGKPAAGDAEREVA